MGAGNLMVATAILFCGLTFTGISNLAKLLNLAMFSESSFYGLQKEYLFPQGRRNRSGCSGFGRTSLFLR